MEHSLSLEAPPSVLSRALVLGVMLSCAPVFAQSFSLADDFETGTLLVSDAPPGQWTDVRTANTSITLEVIADAARTGALGLRVTDGSSGNGDGEQAVVTRSFDPTTGDFWVGFWIRVPAYPAGDYTTPLVIIGQGAPNASLYSVYILYPAVTIGFNGFDADGTLNSYSNARTLVVGQWHRIDAVVRGIGTASGARELYVDGTLAGRMDADLSGIMVETFHLGEPWGKRSWTGVLDFDDVGASTTVPPGLISDAGDVDGGVIDADAGNELDAGSDGGGDGFTDAGADVVIDGGRDAGGSVGSDGGGVPAELPRTLEVAPGCSATGAAWWSFVALMAAILLVTRLDVRTRGAR